ncbi:FliH/SctL family protein [Paraburkholderia adhaesiva]|uniref:FliH/SctL family protein n=1 Tax=Paraburkholderia adhaesiva TaxID=2883244 RepID=UPI001F4630F1|nr:FliH/SctL family protein [Paraburkholderia adhaesiva]
MEAFRARDAECEVARLAERVRALKRRAWRRGYEAGRRAALQKLVVPSAAVSFASHCLEERLADMVLKTVAGILGELPSDVVLPSQLRRCLDASCAQQVLSVRVSADDYDETQRGIRVLEQELNAHAFTVMADADLPSNSLVVETERGVIDGSLTPQLQALELGMRDAIKMLLDEYRYMDDEPARKFDAVESGLRDVIAMLAEPTNRQDGGVKK